MLVLFDVDGTLISTAGAGKRALELAFRRVFGIDGFEARTSDVQYAGRTDPLIIADLAAALGIPGDRLDAEREKLYGTYYEILQDELDRYDSRRRVLPGVVPLLDALNALEDVHVGLVTGNLERGARIKLEAFGLNGYFLDGGFSSDHSDRGQIARIAVEKMSRRTGRSFAPRAVWVVGDTDLDVDCAHVNGYRALAVNSGWIPRERLERANPEVLLETLEDTPAILQLIGDSNLISGLSELS